MNTAAKSRLENGISPDGAVHHGELKDLSSGRVMGADASLPLFARYRCCYTVSVCGNFQRVQMLLASRLLRSRLLLFS